MKAKELIEKYNKWANELIVQTRIDKDHPNYSWFYKTLEFMGEIDHKEIQDFFDRQVLNDEYVRRYKNNDIKSKEAYAWLQTEINIIYSFYKCFALRYRTRLQHYRDDLSQKGVRVTNCLVERIAKLEYLTETTDNDN